ncbi:MAG TPA: M1 family aminopeptidase [Terriglobales bacterium]|nr:M1 family aminopeptidase [Terriglobales bacterium]
MLLARPFVRRTSSGRWSWLLLCILLASMAAPAQNRQRIDVEDYQIDVELQPRTHRLTATARVKFTALDDVNVVSFELHNALRPTKVTDSNGRALSIERVTQDSSVRVSLPGQMSKGESATFTFEYDGILQSADESPVDGLRLAYVGDESFLLYAGRWFPVSGFGTDRFTSTIRVRVPSDYTVIGSGETTPAGVAASSSPAMSLSGMTNSTTNTTTIRTTATASSGSGKSTSGAPALARRGPQAKAKAEAEVKAPTPPPASTSMRTHTFSFTQASFPGTLIAGKFSESRSNAVGLDLRLYFPADKKALMGPYAEAVVKEFQFFAANLGPPLSNTLSVVVLPDDTVPSAWAPEIAAVAARAVSEKVNYRLLANTVAHQWFGVTVSPARKDDWWITDGLSRFLEARYVQSAAGDAAYQEVIKDLSVGALAYDTVPLSSVGRLDTFSPEFQTLVTDKGAVIMSMLRWVIGPAAFDSTLQQFVHEYAGKSASVDDLRAIAEKNYQDNLTWFFTQWLDSTGAPQFHNKYTVFRVNKGFRVVGEISQDLDLFRMPVELRIDTDGKSETKRVDVVGTNSPFTVETFGRPRRIVVDPDNLVLKNSDEIKVRAAILRGQGMVQSGDLANALEQFQKALEIQKLSSLAHYRIAEVFFLQRNYQAAANAYRESLNGDGEPRWTEVWSHIQLGKIFDITGQRERATNEYRQALQTQDNTQGAMDEARKYLQSPYQREKSSNGD